MSGQTPLDGVGVRNAEMSSELAAIDILRPKANDRLLIKTRRSPRQFVEGSTFDGATHEINSISKNLSGSDCGCELRRGRKVIASATSSLNLATSGTSMSVRQSEDASVNFIL